VTPPLWQASSSPARPASLPVVDIYYYSIRTCSKQTCGCAKSSESRKLTGPSKGVLLILPALSILAELDTPSIP
jgi:hypothetical protein